MLDFFLRGAEVCHSWMPGKMTSSQHFVSPVCLKSISLNIIKHYFVKVLRIYIKLIQFIFNCMRGILELEKNWVLVLVLCDSALIWPNSCKYTTEATWRAPMIHAFGTVIRLGFVPACGFETRSLTVFRVETLRWRPSFSSPGVNIQN